MPAVSIHSPFPKTLKWFPISFWVIFKLLPIGFKTFSQAILFYVTFNLSPSCSLCDWQNCLGQATLVTPSLFWAQPAFTYHITHSWLCPSDSSLPLTECLKPQQTSRHLLQHIAIESVCWPDKAKVPRQVLRDGFPTNHIKMTQEEETLKTTKDVICILCTQSRSLSGSPKSLINKSIVFSFFFHMFP